MLALKLQCVLVYVLVWRDFLNSLLFLLCIYFSPGVEFFVPVEFVLNIIYLPKSNAKGLETQMRKL